MNSIYNPPAEGPMERPEPTRAARPSLLGGVRPWQWIALVLAITLFVQTLRHAELGRALALIREVGPKIALVLVPSILVLLTEAWGWMQLLALTGHRVSVLTLFRIRVSTEAIFLSVPGGPVAVEGLKPLLLEERVNVPRPVTAATLAACKFFLVTTQGLYLLVGVTLAWGRLGRASSAIFGGAALLPAVVVGMSLLLLVLGAVLLATLSQSVLAERIHSLLMYIPIARVRRRIDAAREGFLHTDRALADIFGASRSRLVLCALPFFVGWLCEALDTYVALRVLGVRLGLGEVICFDATASLIRSLAFVVPAGLGLTDVGYLAFLRGLDVDHWQSVGGAFILLKRSKDLCWILVGGAMFVAGRLRARASAKVA